MQVAKRSLPLPLPLPPVPRHTCVSVEQGKGLAAYIVADERRTHRDDQIALYREKKQTIKP
jgi:hypothetical protein